MKIFAIRDETDNTQKNLAYDEFSLLMLCSGHCGQDDYYLVPIDENALPGKVACRYNRKEEKNAKES